MLSLYKYYRFFYSILIIVEFLWFGYTVGFIINHFMLYRFSQEFGIFSFYNIIELVVRNYHLLILPSTVLMVSVLSIIVYICHGIFISKPLLSLVRVKISLFIKEFIPYLLIISGLFAITNILKNIYRLHIDLRFADVISQMGYSHFLLLGINSFFFNLVAYVLFNYSSYIIIFLIRYGILQNITTEEQV